MPPKSWIAIDWGTSNMRLWHMQGDQVVQTVTSDRGMGALSPDEYEPLLLELLGPIGPEPVQIVICGMAGARQGWAEAPYLSVPAKPARLPQAIRPLVQNPALDVRILPGLSQDAPADVMRGEETQIAGFLHNEPNFDGVLCLPGTHSKWAHISAGEVVSFSTYMTGELFALLSKQSVLRHSVGTGWDDEAFATAVGDAMSHPARLSTHLFSLRAGSLLRGLTEASATARLSGLLIGMELAAARPYWLGQDIVILGAPALADRYETALRAQGAMCRCVPGDDMSRLGLIAAWEDPS